MKNSYLLRDLTNFNKIFGKTYVDMKSDYKTKLYTLFRRWCLPTYVTYEDVLAHVWRFYGTLIIRRANLVSLFCLIFTNIKMLFFGLSFTIICSVIVRNKMVLKRILDMQHSKLWDLLISDIYELPHQLPNDLKLEYYHSPW